MVTTGLGVYALAIFAEQGVVSKPHRAVRDSRRVGPKVAALASPLVQARWCVGGVESVQFVAFADVAKRVGLPALVVVVGVSPRVARKLLAVPLPETEAEVVGLVRWCFRSAG